MSATQVLPSVVAPSGPPAAAPPARARSLVALLSAGTRALSWRTAAGCAVAALLPAAAIGLSPGELTTPALTLALLALGCVVAVAAEEPAADVAQVSPVGPRARLALRAQVCCLVGAAVLAGVVLLAGLAGSAPGRTYVARAVLVALVALAAAVASARLWSDVPPVAAAAMALGQGLVVEQFVDLTVITDTAVWRSTPGRLGVTALVAGIAIALATRDPGGRPLLRRE